MARPNKIGLEYFPFEVDFFNDEKIGAISGEFGIKGELACIKLLCAIYRNGYFILWSEMLQMKLIKELSGVSVDLLNSIVSRLVRWGFFDKTLFDESGILTSKGIQRRYFEIVKRRLKNMDDLPYLLVNACNNPVSVYINHSSTDINVCNNSQSKVKENNIVEIRNSVGYIESGDNAQARKRATPPKSKPDSVDDFEKRKQLFISQCAVFVEKYDSEMVRNFSDYWTEPNKSRTKMRFELEKTWDLGRRLNTWDRNESKFNGHGNNQKSGKAGSVRPSIDELRAAVEGGIALAAAEKNRNRV